MESLDKHPVLRSAVALAAFGGLTAAAAAIGARATIKGKGPWYAALKKAPYNPPDWVFGPVWTLLYGTIALSGWRVYRQPHSLRRTTALGLWGAQLGLNALWSVIFFGEHKKRLALLDIGMLVGAIKAYMTVAQTVDPPAAALMKPYLAWCSFATLLNEEIVKRNPSQDPVVVA